MHARIVAVLVAFALAALIDGAIAVPSVKKPAKLSDADRAARAAVAATRGGKAVKVAREAENGATWEVEVARPGGRRSDVLLDARFRAMSVTDEREPSERRAGARGPGSASSNAAGSGRQAHRAAQAAAKSIGGGMLIDVDRAVEKGAAWEVEFIKLDGKKVSVLLDDRYRVVSVTRGKKAS